MLVELKRELGFLDVFCIAAGAMISSGIFVLPGLAHAKAGPSVILSYIAAGGLAAIGMLNAAELATAMPKAGGDYFFITRTLGPAAGSVSGLINWFSLSLKSAFAMVGMAAFIQVYMGIDIRISGIVLCAVFALLNLAGTRHAGRIQIFFVLVLFILMGAYIVSGFSHIRMTNLQPFAPYGFNRTLATAGFVFIAYGGLIKISAVAEEVRKPAKTIPRAMFLALILVTAVYAMMVLVTTGVLQSEQLDRSMTPITDGATVFMSPLGVRLISLGALLAFVSTANAGIMSASRYLFALSRDELLPGGISRLSKRTGVPYRAILITAAFICSALFLKLDVLVEAASLVLILGFIFSCVCVIILRESRVQNYRPSFRVPLYPLPQIIGILGFGLLVFGLGLGAYLISALLFTLGMCAYWLFGRKRVTREYALLHLLERITSRDLVTGSLERELLDVVRERDEMATDQFDETINRAPILDLPGRPSINECLELAAEQLAEQLHMSASYLTDRFIQHEEANSSLLNSFIAIPHIVIPGSHTFEVMLVRAANGIVFPDQEQDAHALFILVGTKDERNFHLKVLAGVAQIAQDPEFESRWLRAKTPEDIRNVILLGKRMRTHA
jgi:amino acid transporter